MADDIMKKFDHELDKLRTAFNKKYSGKPISKKVVGKFRRRVEKLLTKYLGERAKEFEVIVIDHGNGVFNFHIQKNHNAKKRR